MGFERREIYGSVVEQALSSTITSLSTSITVTNGSSFPTGQLNPFVIVIGRGTATEEKILVSSRTGNVFTVALRGYDGTAAVDHNGGEFVDHVLDANSVQSMNTAVFDGQILYWMGV